VWIDSHTHLQFPQFEKDVDGVVARAKDAGVGMMVVVGTDLATSRGAVACADRFGLYATAGVHPHEATSFDERAGDEVRRLAAHPRVVAVGEIGLDYARDYSPRPAQRDTFRTQLELAADLGLPVVVHCRDAEEDVIEHLDEVFGLLAGGVLHCFSGGDRLVEKASEWGFYVSAAGHITRPDNEPLRQTLARVPLDALLVETDCPYLMPASVKRKGLNRNEPAFVPAVGECLASVKGVSPAEIESATTANAVRLFGIDIGEEHDAACCTVQHNKGLNT
jgi:TatD DNase family protein